MVSLNNFDASTVDPTTELAVLPAGKYVAVLEASEMKPTKAGDGRYLSLTFQVIDGPFKGRKVWDRLVLEHPSAAAVQIARGKLSSLCRAVGVLQPKDSAELHGKPLVLTVKCVKRSDCDELGNDISGYAKREIAPSASTPSV